MMPRPPLDRVKLREYRMIGVIDDQEMGRPDEGRLAIRRRTVTFYGLAIPSALCVPRYTRKRVWRDP